MNTSSQLCRQEVFFTCLFIGLGTVNIVHHSSCLLAFKSSFNRTYLSTVDTKNTREYRRSFVKKRTIQRKKKGLSNTHFTVVNLKEIFDLKTLRLQ